jgi:hypothetical protein
MPSIAELGEPEQPHRSAPPLLRAAFVLYSLLFAASLAWTGCEERSVVFATPEDSRLGVHWLRDVAQGLGVGGALVAASRALSRLTSAGRALEDALAGALGRPGALACLMLAALSGVAEEAFFRGALQPRVGLVAASLLFGLAHFVPRREFLAWPVFGAAAGLVFGALFTATGNLVAPALAHFTVNALNLRWLTSGAGQGGRRPGSAPERRDRVDLDQRAER